ncbi:hypothetical protein LIA77_06125 [Sarocladium implicatum]|nr:hypothetical protein LIA77_06125 [Sarocladium implicatum]
MLRDRYPDGLTTSIDPPKTTPIPEETSIAYAVLNVANDPTRGWKKLKIGEQGEVLPQKAGMKENSIVAFAFVDSSEDEPEFEVEWPPLGDPQLEGDTSIPTKQFGTLPHLKKIIKRVAFKKDHPSLRDRIRMILHDTIDFYFEDIPHLIESWRKAFDLFGNDFYLAHIYRTVHWWTRPSHVTVLGDLVGSQWIDDVEFERRGRRYWNRAFKGSERVPDEIATWPEDEYLPAGYLDGSANEDIWKKRIMNVAGNHDIGYAGDLTPELMDRFERVFGKANYELRFELPITDPEVNATTRDNDPDSYKLPPEIRILVINDMNLDTPAKSGPLQDQTYNFINKAIHTSADVKFQGHMTLILTHIPMYKPAGVCVDAPYFAFHTQEEGGGVKEQYLLSADASKGFLEGIFGVSKDRAAAGNGLGRQGLVLNGHDHEGCDTYHYINHTHGEKPDDRKWEYVRWSDAQAQNIPLMDLMPGRREITVRSMMGDFGGNAGLLSMWFDQDAWQWRYEYATCPLGRQHFWWLVHILDFAALLGVVLYGIVRGLEKAGFSVDAALCRAWRIAQHMLRAVREKMARRGQTSSSAKEPNGTMSKTG